jgi:hypothetical protein
MQTRGSRFVRFQELRLQERAIEARTLLSTFLDRKGQNKWPTSTQTPPSGSCPASRSLLRTTYQSTTLG